MADLVPSCSDDNHHPHVRSNLLLHPHLTCLYASLPATVSYRLLRPPSPPAVLYQPPSCSSSALNRRPRPLASLTVIAGDPRQRTLPPSVAIDNDQSMRPSHPNSESRRLPSRARIARDRHPSNSYRNTPANEPRALCSEPWPTPTTGNEPNPQSATTLSK